MKRFQAKLSDLLVFLANKGFILCQLMETDDLEIYNWNDWQLFFFAFHYWLEFSYNRLRKGYFFK